MYQQQHQVCILLTLTPRFLFDKNKYLVRDIQILFKQNALSNKMGEKTAVYKICCKKVSVILVLLQEIGNIIIKNQNPLSQRTSARESHYVFSKNIFFSNHLFY